MIRLEDTQGVFKHNN